MNGGSDMDESVAYRMQGCVREMIDRWMDLF